MDFLSILVRVPALFAHRDQANWLLACGPTKQMSIKNAAKAAADKEEENRRNQKVAVFREKLSKILQTNEFDILVGGPYDRMIVEIEDMVFTHNGYSFDLVRFLSYKGVKTSYFEEEGCGIYSAACLGKAINDLEEKHPELREEKEKKANAKEVARLALPPPPTTPWFQRFKDWLNAD